MLSPQLRCSSPTAVKGIWRVPHPVWPIVKYVHQLESVAIRQTRCEHVRQSICWHGGQRYVINADFTLHWIELATLATTSMLIHPIKTSLFIYLQLQPPDMRGMKPPYAFQTHGMLIFFICITSQGRVPFLRQHLYFLLGQIHTFFIMHTCLHTFCTVYSWARRSLILSGYELDSRNYICDTNPASPIEHFIPELSRSLFITSYSP